MHFFRDWRGCLGAQPRFCLFAVGFYGFWAFFWGNRGFCEIFYGFWGGFWAGAGWMSKEKPHCAYSGA